MRAPRDLHHQVVRWADMETMPNRRVALEFMEIRAMKPGEGMRWER